MGLLQISQHILYYCQMNIPRQDVLNIERISDFMNFSDSAFDTFLKAWDPIGITKGISSKMEAFYILNGSTSMGKSYSRQKIVPFHAAYM